MYLINVLGHLYEGTSSRAANFEGLSNKNLNVGMLVFFLGFSLFRIFMTSEIGIRTLGFIQI